VTVSASAPVSPSRMAWACPTSQAGAWPFVDMSEYGARSHVLDRYQHDVAPLRPCGVGPPRVRPDEEVLRDELPLGPPLVPPETQSDNLEALERTSPGDAPLVLRVELSGEEGNRLGWPMTQMRDVVVLRRAMIVMQSAQGLGEGLGASRRSRSPR